MNGRSPNPFDDEGGRFHILVNDEAQHSLWPAFADLPAGWRVRLSDVPHAAAVAYVKEHWTDMRPKSLIDAMTADATAADATAER